MKNREMHIALRNSGYRFIGEKSGVYNYGKPLGYGFLSAYFRPEEAKIEILLMVKEPPQKDKHLNAIWKSVRHDISSEHEDLYLNCVQTIKDCEVEIFSTTPVAWQCNRFVRYDFEENPSLDIY